MVRDKPQTISNRSLFQSLAQFAEGTAQWRDDAEEGQQAETFMYAKVRLDKPELFWGNAQ